MAIPRNHRGAVGTLGPAGAVPARTDCALRAPAPWRGAPQMVVMTPRMVVSATNLAAPQVLRNGVYPSAPQAPWLTPRPASPRQSLTRSGRGRDWAPMVTPSSWLSTTPTAGPVSPGEPPGSPLVSGFDALAVQMQKLQEAKSLAANELLQSEKRIALRKEQLRKETLKAARDSGWLEALQRWSPTSEKPSAAPSQPVAPVELAVTPPRTPRDDAVAPTVSLAEDTNLDDDLELPATSSTLLAPEPPPPPPEPAQPSAAQPAALPVTVTAAPVERRSRSSRSASPKSSPRGASTSLLEEAKHCSKALSRIASQVSARNLRELRKLQQAPPQVLKILEATAVLLGEKWSAVPSEAVSGLLAHEDLPQRLGTLDVVKITALQRSKVRNLLKLPDVQPDAIAAVCHPCASLSQWCECVMTFLTRTASLVAPAKSSAKTRGASPKSSESPQESSTANGHAEPDESKLMVEPDLNRLTHEQLKAVRELTVTRSGVGSVIFHGVTDCSDVQVQRDIVLNKGFILVYPDPKRKPPPGCGLNKPATVTMFNCFPPGELQMDDHLVREDYKEKIRLMTEENQTCKFLDYDCQSGVWQFEVNKF